jgi:HAMP domain-containing protein
MHRLLKTITQTLSVRISLMVVFAMAILLMASLTAMLHYSKRVVKEEALNKAVQILDATVLRIDNILLSVEQSTGNIFFSLMANLDNPDVMFDYSRKLVEANPYVAGCAIAFKENFFKDRQYFMAYVYRSDGDTLSSTDSPIIQSEIFGSVPYTEQVWFTTPMKSGKPGWLNPLTGLDDSIEPLVTFCLPIYGPDRQPVGVIGIDLTLKMLSNIVAAAKPSANSYCTLLDRDGSFIVHPDSKRLMHLSAFSVAGHEADPSASEAVKAMTSGETGYRRFCLQGNDYYVFYKPFKRLAVPGRSADDLGWSAGIIYPEDDIFGFYNSLSGYVFAIAIVGLLLLYLLCQGMIHRQLLPLRMLATKAQRIAQGNYDEPIPDSKQKDEIGRLQDNFQQMQRSLAANIGELEHLKNSLEERGQGLRNALRQAQKADRMKTSFLHNMTNQMLEPSNAISQAVETLCDSTIHKSEEETKQLVGDIQQNGKTITELLNGLINVSDEEKLLAGKEVVNG